MDDARPGPAYWNDPATVDAWLSLGPGWQSPVATMEAPAFWRLAGDVAGTRVLDVGCGDGRLGAELLERGATSYHGIDPSRPLLERGRLLASSRLTVAQSTIETVDLGGATFDLVVSRLVLHYVADLEAALRAMAAAVVPGGAVVYTVEHPVITSHESELSRDADGFRTRWVVDDYFAAGQRDIDWFAGRVRKYHRPLEDHVRTLARCGLRVADLDEGRPDAELFDGHDDEYRRRARIPLFLGIRAERTGG